MPKVGLSRMMVQENVLAVKVREHGCDLKTHCSGMKGSGKNVTGWF